LVEPREDGAGGLATRLANLLPVGVSRRDPFGDLTFANAAWRRMAGLGDGPVSTDAWRQAIHSEDRERVVAVWAALPAMGGDLRLDYRVRREDGTVRWLVEGAVAERDAAGRCLGYLGTLMDVTDARELAARLDRSRRLEALGQLAGGVAHDFNNLLMIVLANAEILEELAERGDVIAGERVGRIARTLLNAAERGAGLTRTLLGFARTGKPHVETLDANRHLAELGEMLRRSLGGAVTLVFDLAAEPDLIEVDPAQFDTAILNLALNARDAMPDGGTLVLATAGRAGEVVLSLSDTGSGMTPEVAARAVEPFFSHGRPPSRGGLGLSIVQNVVEQAGGTLHLDTAPGRGTVVTLRFPAGCADAAQGPPVSSPMPDARARRLLVVDDIPPVLAIMADQARRLGFAVETAATAEEALARMTSGEAFDVLLSDIELGPGLDGIGLAREATRQWPDLRVLLTTGNPMGARGDGLEPDLPPVLVKPFSQRDLAGALRDLLETPAPG